MKERTNSATGPEVPRNNGEFEDGGGLLAFGDDLDDEEAGPQPDDASKALVVAFGQTMKTLRVRERMDRETLGRALGYSAATIASYEQGRRIPSTKTIIKADQVLNGDGLLLHWLDQMDQAQFPATFQGMAALEKKAIELLMYDTLVFPGLLQTEEYMRALFAMRRPLLDQDTVEQRVAARLARQEIFERWPAPLMSFIIDEAILRRPHGGKEVLRGQLEHLLLAGQRRNVEIQVMPLDREENAGVTGPFTIVTRRKDGKQFLYGEASGVTSLQTDPEHVSLAHARYGIIRSQALPSRESMQTIEGVLGSL
ncbi:helix-turn-helix transcriptional regulator [Streptomyces roseirectus]|uniref:Helix-turn-helix transcriptional regulator n=1 Tax=Streptomyces roseirectus TaxID=2768066 RepID=A0A7H0ILT8_9ACTN|nr:helix-turn-helix transcriptional regulator [Streptomyces roseirectus]QNP73754.1 helix-turn-helix transcriptional regulator [Streptomyces roseirectus]